MWLMDNFNPFKCGYLKPIFGMSFAVGDPPAGDPPPADPPPPPPPADPPPAGGNWKTGLASDIANSPLAQKFEDTPDGLNKMVASHASLEQMLGQDKVPIPKGPDDTEGWNRFSKAMGIPDKAEEYGLADAEIPDNLKDMSFDKQRFAEVMHSFKATSEQAKGLWGAYTDMVKESYGKALETHRADMEKVVNTLKSEMGDAYDTNVELGQMVINRFSADKEMEDYLTATLSKDPRGIKFLAKVGNQFAENKIGDFGYKKFSLTPDQAQSEIDAITADPNHPYMNDKATQQERDRAVDYVNSLYAAIQKAKG